MNKSRRSNKRITAVIIGVMVMILPCMLLARDRGINQPGAVGKAGAADPGVNQPGAAGNRRQP